MIDLDLITKQTAEIRGRADVRNFNKFVENSNPNSQLALAIAYGQIKDRMADTTTLCDTIDALVKRVRELQDLIAYAVSPEGVIASISEKR